MKSYLHRFTKKCLILWIQVGGRSSLYGNMLSQFKNELTKKEPVFPSAPLCLLMDSFDFGSQGIEAFINVLISSVDLFDVINN